MKSEMYIGMPRLNRRQVLAGTTGLLATSVLPAAAAGGSQEPNSWKREADIPWKIQEVYGALYNGKAVIVGGMVVSDGRRMAIDRMGMFDPETGTWQEGTPLPSPRHHPVLAVVGDRLYAMGGARHGFPGEPTGDHWRQQTDVFILENDKWTRGPSLPMAQSEGVAITRGDHIHLITGRTSLSPMSTRWDEQHDVDYHQVLDTRTGSWSFAAPAPAPRNSAGGGEIDGKFYLVGGRTMKGGQAMAGVNIARLDMYDPTEDRWHELAPLPEPAGGLAAAVFDNRLYAFGGERLGMDGPGGVIGKSWRYDPATDKWDALPDMLTPRHGLTAVALKDRILLIGGGSLPATGQTTNITEAYFPEPDK